MLPETSLVRRSFTIRQMDLPPAVKLTKRSLLRWFALAFGLISEKDSRNTALHILDALFYFLFTKKRAPTTLDIQSHLSEKSNTKISEKLIRYHLNKLIALQLLDRKKNQYFINPAPEAERDDLKAAFAHWIKNSVNESMANIETVMEKLSENY